MPEISTESFQKMADIAEPRCVGTCGGPATLAFFGNENEPFKEHYCDTCPLPHDTPPAKVEDLDHATELREILAAL